MSIMNLLYDGKIYPAEQAVSSDPNYVKTNREIEILMEKLEEKLDKEDYDLVEKVCDLLSVTQDIQNKEVFRYGLSLGLQLMWEAGELPYLKECGRDPIRFL
ncbi:MAG: hypothetical protein LUI87_07380 [Lachnospiraceae bacterium]|nr:hypothetical protein [Lachnospiraceae bacterium]